MSQGKKDRGIREFQRRIEEIYQQRDAARGVADTYMWLIEEIGELSRSLRSQPPGSREEEEEFADCLAWLSTLASLRGVDLSRICWQKYGDGCPRCAAIPCTCLHRAPPEP